MPPGEAAKGELGIGPVTLVRGRVTLCGEGYMRRVPQDRPGVKQRAGGSNALLSQRAYHHSTSSRR